MADRSTEFVGNRSHRQQEGPDREAGPDGQLPYWKRAHHDWRFWVGLFCMFAAITIYILSDDLAFLPLGRPRPPLSGAATR